MPGRNYIGPSGYRYGFGTQEKDDEIYGAGNSYSAEFWQYDPRLGRRWNTDPIIKVWESPYATFENNPIYYNDISGATTDDEGDDKKKAPEKKGNIGDKKGGYAWITPQEYSDRTETETKYDGYSTKTDASGNTYVRTDGTVPTTWVQYGSGTSSPAPTGENTAPSTASTDSDTGDNGNTPKPQKAGTPPEDKPKPPLNGGNKPPPNSGGTNTPPLPDPLPKFQGVEIPDCGTKKFSFPILFEAKTDLFYEAKRIEILQNIAKLSVFLSAHPKLELTVSGNVAGGPGNILGDSPAALNQGGFVLNKNSATAAQLMIARAQSVHRTMNLFSVKNPIKIATGSVFNGAEGLLMNFYITNPCKK